MLWGCLGDAWGSLFMQMTPVLHTMSSQDMTSLLKNLETYVWVNSCRPRKDHFKVMGVMLWVVLGGMLGIMIG
jgi:uncharacterized protein YcfJ